MLPNDVARCAGVGNDEEGWREGCEDCARRLSESTGAGTAWMLPPAIIAFWCEFRIETPNAKVTGEPRSGESSTEGAMSTAVLGATRPGKE